MGNWIRCLTTACLASVIAASPIQPDKPNKSQSKRQFEFGDLADVYKGINWDYVAEDCSDFQWNILLAATESAIKATNLNKPEQENSPAWNRYFNGVNPGEDGRWMSKEGEPVYANIRNNLVQVSEFPKRGKLKNGKTDRKRQVQYRCKEIPYHDKCARGRNEQGKWDGPSAYTADPRANEAGWAIVFCPRFFEDPQSNMLMSGRENERKREPEKIHELYTYEHIMIHEWMHNKLFGYKEHITDVVGEIGHGWPGEFKIYGDKNCHYFAWKNEPELNFNVAVNADTYAWFFTYNYFHDVWGWDSDGHFDTKKRSLEGRDEPDWDDEILWDEDSDFKGSTPESELNNIKWEVPENVAMNEEYLEDDGDEVISVGYLGQGYETWKKAYENEEDYQAEDSDCVLSWQCAKMVGHSLNPECTCTCDDEVVGGTFWEDKRCKGIQVGFEIQV